MRRFKQSGYITILAVFIITIIGTLAASIVYLFNTKASATGYIQAQPKALALAATAIEEGAMHLSLGNSCSSIATTKSLGNGIAISGKATQSSYTINPLFSSATLLSTISANANTIPVSNAQVFAPQGQIMIDKEIIHYKQNDNNHLSKLTRGIDNSPQNRHVRGAIVSQLLCSIAGSGQSPANNPQSQRTLVTASPLSMAYSIGAGNTFWQFNHPNNENRWRSMRRQTPGNTQTYRAISLLNQHEGFAVGHQAGGRLRIARLHHATWQQENSTVGQSDLFGVSSVSTTEAWAVGERSNNQFNIFRWDGNSWCHLLTSSSCGNKRYASATSNAHRDLFAVKVLSYQNTNGSGDFGFAAGGSSNHGTILQYNGQVWQDALYPANTIGQVLALDIISNGNGQPIEAWSAGKRRTSNQGEIIRYANGNWQVSSRKLTSRRMRAISMIDMNGNGLADFGFAVGDRSTIYTYRHGTWNNGQRNPNGVFGGNRTLRGVSVISPSNAWVVADGGRTYHWNGQRWTQVTKPNGALNRTLYAIDGIGPKTTQTIGFREMH